jgi:chromosome segregation ATPase
MKLEHNSAEREQYLTGELTQATQKLALQSIQLAEYAKDASRANAALESARADLSSAGAYMQSIDHSTRQRDVLKRNLLSRIALLEPKAQANLLALEDLKAQLHKSQTRVAVLERWHKLQKLQANMFRNQVIRKKVSSTKVIDKIRAESKQRRLKKLGVYGPRVRSKTALLRAHGVSAKRIREVIKATAPRLSTARVRGPRDPRRVRG